MLHIVKIMSKNYYNKCSIFLNIALLFIFINFCTSAPVSKSENPYTQFIAELNRNKCSVPSQVQLPFDTSKVNNFEYLSPYLEICQKTESTKRNKEAVVLCKEIFDNIRNISCPTKTALPDINLELSKHVCKDISAQKDSVPEDDKSLLKRLTDSFLCEIMCDSEFEKACQVLLWSFEVQKSIARVVSTEEPEQPSALEEAGEITDKQDNTVDEGNLPQIVANPENSKHIIGEAKDVNEVAAHDMAEEPETKELKEIPEQKNEETAAPSKDGKQENPIPANKAVVENLTAPKTESQDLSTGVSKSTSSLKTSSTLSQQTPSTSNSNTEIIPLQEVKKVESSVQNMNKQLQDENANIPDAKHGETDAEALPSKTNSASDAQTQSINSNSLGDGEGSNIKDNNIPQDEDVQGNLGKPNMPSNPEDGNNNEIVDEVPNPDLNIPSENELPHEKSPNDATVDVHANEQNLSNLDDNLAQNDLQNTAKTDDELAKKTNAPITSSQTIKDTIQHQTIPETSLDKTSIPKEETKTDQTENNSDLRKVDAQNQAKTEANTHDLITGDVVKDVPTDQKKPKVTQQTAESDNTIPDTTGIPIDTNEKPPEKSQSKPTVGNPDGKSVVPSSLTETSTKTTVALEKMEGGGDLRPPADEEDPYDTLGNADDPDYRGPDYDAYESSKTKESNIGVPSPVSKEIISNEKPIEFPARNPFGQDSSDIQMIGFPEQEDSHFFFYFLSIVLILMAGYLLFHNKQKIIALIVEGRHERNRRSHRIGYKKLETK